MSLTSVKVRGRSEAYSVCMKPRSIGFPCTRHERAEVREYLPPLFAFLKQFELERVVVEDGYGGRMGLPPEQYVEALPSIRWSSREEAWNQDLVVLLRCPSEGELRRLERGATVLAMLHFPTRPERVRLMNELGVTGVAIDQVVDDLGRRLVENLEAVGFNGIRVGMETLAKGWAEFASPSRGPLRVTVLGAGIVGAHAVRGAVRYGDDVLRAKLQQLGVAGVVVTVLDFELTRDEAFLEATLRNTDVLVDATQRRDPTQPIVRNGQLAMLPQHAVIVDLSVDPYDLQRNPPAFKGIEGIPQGTLDQFVFRPDDPAWAGLDARVPHDVRRAVVSCYSWPGIQPVRCMEVYGAQLQPVVRALLEHGPELPTEGKTWAERATARAFHHRWLSPEVTA